MIYIQKNFEHVLGIDGDKVVAEVKDENKNGQLWIKGKETDEGYFTLKNFESSKFLECDWPRTAPRLPQGQDWTLTMVIRGDYKFLFPL